MEGRKLLKVGRTLRGMTQQDVVLLYGGISISTYRRWESGASPISYDDLSAIIEQVFQLSFAHLLTMDLSAHEQLKIPA